MNVPKLRFKEFNDKYNITKVSEIIDVIDGDRGNNYPKANDFYDSEFCLFLNAGNVTKNGFNFKNNQFITKEKDEKLRKGKLSINDIVLTTRGTVGNVAWFNEKTPYKNIRINSGMVINRIKENGDLLPEYLYSYMKSQVFENQVNKMNYGSAQPQLTVSDINNFNIQYPTINEQKKVSTIMLLLDKKIELQSKKIEDLKLFTKNIISSELNNLQNYNIFKFKDICNIQTGKSNTQDKCDNGIYPFYIRSENIERSNNYIFDCEAVLTIGDGNIGKVFFYENGKFDCHQRVYVLNNFKNVLGKYVYYYFSSFFYKRAMSMSAKNTVDSVRMEMISDMIIKVPQEKEQIKMINLFSCLDKKLGLEQNKLDKLQELKKGLMQNMFV